MPLKMITVCIPLGNSSHRKFRFHTISVPTAILLNTSLSYACLCVCASVDSLCVCVCVCVCVCASNRQIRRVEERD